MLTASVLGPFLIAVVVICVAPGPDMAFVMASGLSRGRRGALLAATGVSAGVTVWVLITAFGLGTLVTELPEISTGLRVAGACYLAYLAWDTWRSAGKHAEDDVSDYGQRMFWRGTMTNLANPKMALFFTAFLPQFVDADNGSVILQFVVLGLIMQAIGWIVDAVVGVAAGGARDLLGRRPGIRTNLDRAAGGVFAALAIAVVIELVVA
jgi:threonine/homoserine/homoserine lactone efflux protein